MGTAIAANPDRQQGPHHSRDNARMQPEHRLRIAQALIFVTPALWSANYIAARTSVGVLEPHMLAFLRWLVAFCVMLPIAWPALRRAPRAWRREWKQMTVLGALGMWICGAFVYIGGQTTVAVNIGLLYAISPVMVAALSAPLFGERLTPAQVLGIALALTGTVTVIAKGSVANILAVQFTRGDLWVVAAMLSWTAYALLLRRWSSALDTFARLTVTTFFGLLVLLPFTIAEGLAYGWPTPSWQAAGLVLVVALLPGLGAYQCYAYMQRELGTSHASLSLYLGPLYAAGVSWLLLGERPGWYHAVGALLILPGIWLATRRAR